MTAIQLLLVLLYAEPFLFQFCLQQQSAHIPCTVWSILVVFPSPLLWFALEYLALSVLPLCLFHIYQSKTLTFSPDPSDAFVDKTQSFDVRCPLHQYFLEVSQSLLSSPSQPTHKNQNYLRINLETDRLLEMNSIH